MKKLIIILLSGLFWSFTSLTGYADSFEMHTVRPKDTYWEIAQEHNKHIDEIKSINNASDDLLLEGAFIRIQPLPRAISIEINGKPVKSDPDPYLENNRAFVPIRSIAEALGIKEISWNEESKTAILKDDEMILNLPYGSQTAEINGKEIELDAPVNILEGRTFVPVRFIAETLNCTVEWDAENYQISITTGPHQLSSTKTSYTSAIENYTEEDLYWLSRIVESEAPDEPYEGKLAVANVVLNRKKSSDFPNTIKKVIFQKANGYYQFTPVKNGSIYNEPSEESIKAAKEALEGKNNIAESLFFLNPKTSVYDWIISNRKFYKTIENHDFYL